MILERLANDKKPELSLNKLQLEMIELVNNKVESGEYQFEETECPVCHHKKRDLIGKKDRYGLYYPTNICRTCGLVYTSPRMTQSSYNDFYNHIQKNLYVGVEEPGETYFLRQRKKGKRIYEFLEKNKVTGNGLSGVLEVGCSAGGIIDYFRENGYKVKGVDLSEKYINYGRDVHGLDLEVGTLKSLKINEKPGLIIYSHVLEHILDLNTEIELIKQVADRDTLIYVEVPGIKAIHRSYDMNILKYLQNAHTYHFSLETLVNLMSVHGFELVKGTRYVRSVFRLTNRKAKIRNDYYKVLRYIKSLERERLSSYPVKLGSKILRKLF